MPLSVNMLSFHVGWEHRTGSAWELRSLMWCQRAFKNEHSCIFAVFAGAFLTACDAAGPAGGRTEGRTGARRAGDLTAQFVPNGSDLASLALIVVQDQRATRCSPCANSAVCRRPYERSREPIACSE